MGRESVLLTKKYKYIRGLLLSAAITTLMVSCNASQTASVNMTNPKRVELSPVPVEFHAQTEASEEISTEDLTGKALNVTTGLYIDEAEAHRRAVAVVINNMVKAQPQSGISQADIIYEVLAEGDITRMIAIFREFDSEKIGPVRSARDYFLYFAKDHDAIFVHHGRSPMANTEINRLNVENMDGMSDSQVFWRDPVRFNQKGMYEHSSYTDAEDIKIAFAKYGYRDQCLPNDSEAVSDTITMNNNNPSGAIIQTGTGLFDYYKEFTTLENGQNVSIVRVPYSKSQRAYFEYNETSKQYARYQFDAPHIDEETGKQLMFDNVIIQFTQMYVIPGDDAGRRDVDTIGSGSGYVITAGKYQPISWEKTSYAEPTKWFDSEGNRLALNRGKTWICVYQSGGEIIFE